MGIFTDLYNVGSIVGKPLSGVIKYGAKQADSFLEDLIGENKTEEQTNDVVNEPTPKQEGTVVVDTLSGMSVGELKKVITLSKSNEFSNSEIADIVSTESRSIMPNAIEEAKKSFL